MSIAIKDISGLGPKTAAYLAEQGIYSVQQLLDADADILLHAPGFHVNRVRTVLANAAMLMSAEGRAGELEEPVTADSVTNRDKKSAKEKKKKGNKEKAGKKKKGKIKKDKKKRKKKKKIKGKK